MATQVQEPVVRQSRVGKQPIAVPAGVQVTIDGNTIKLKGPKGASERSLPTSVVVSHKDSQLLVTQSDTAGRTGAQFQGLTRALLQGMVTGVSQGYALSLDLHGVGYRAELAGQNLTLSLGLSHQVKMTLPAAILAKVETIDEGGQKRPRLHLSSHDKELLGEVAAKLRSYRPPEPYKGKGVRYTGEKVREKAGKAGAKGKK